MFTAVLPPREVVEELDRLLDPRRDADSSLRWTRPGGWHVTTSFMASVDRYRLDALEENLAEVAARAAPFPLALAGGVTSGQLLLIGAVPVVSPVAAPAGELVAFKTGGVCEVPKATGGAITQGAKLYFDATNKVVTTSASGNTPCGHAWADAASDATVAALRLSAF